MIHGPRRYRATIRPDASGIPRLLAALILATVLACAPQGAARAAEPGDFVAEVSKAYPHFKMAWFYCRTGNGMLAEEEIGSFIAAWRTIEAHFAAKPTPAFAADAKWGDSLKSVGAVLGRAKGLIAADKPREALPALDEVRQLLAALRKRNGVTVFSDYVEQYSTVIDRLVALRTKTRNMPTLAQQDLDAYAALARDLRAAVERLRAQAPAHLAGDEGFNASLKGNLDSIGKLERGIKGRSARAVHGSVSSVRADFVLLFTRYG
jgi:hypothetical protein